MFPLFAQAAEPNKIRDMVDSLARTPLSQVVMFVAACTVIRVILFPFIMGTAPHKRLGGFKLAIFGNELSDAIIYAGVFVFMIIRPFLVQTFTIPTGSMLNTLQLNDFIIANKAIYRYSDPKPGDIVVFKPPQIALRDSEKDQDYIKRCIGGPGDLIEIKQGQLYRNEQKIEENYIDLWFNSSEKRMSHDFKLVKYKGEYWPVVMSDLNTNNDPTYSAQKYYVTTSTEMDLLRSLPAEKIPPGYFLMMGDNREGSYDGRAWGLVPKQSIIGKSMVIWLPVNRWRVTK